MSKMIKNKIVELAIAKILSNLGINLNEPDFIDTPNRVARMYSEMFYMRTKQAQEELKDILSTTFPTDNDEMIVVQNIQTCSLCPHHLTIVDYNIDVAYIPIKKAIGLSKIARFVELLSKQPILQEQLTVLIAKHLMDILKPLGVGVRIKGKHYCMIARGIKQRDSFTVTSALLGVFKDKEATRAEFLSFIT